MIAGLEPVAVPAVRRSPLANRVVLAVDGRVRPDWVQVQQAPTVARAAATGVFGLGLPNLFFNHLNTADAGLGRLATYGEFSDAVRALVDDVLDPRADGWVVESVPSGIPLEIAEAVYPDARVVHPGESLADAVAGPAPPGGSGHPSPTDLTDHLILVVGAPRSGTTWFERLLMSHPQAGGIDEGESWVFRAVSDFWTNHRGAGELAAVTDAPGLSRALRRFTSRLLGLGLATTPSACWFVEKTPGHVFLLQEIGAVWPDAWVINLVRDGRDVARSGAQMVHGPADLRDAAAAWAASVKAADDHGASLRRFREVRYESLLEDPVGVTVDVLGWAGLPVGAAVEATVLSAVGKRVSRYNTTGPVGAGKWQSLTPAEIRIVLAVAGDALVARGYVGAGEVHEARRALRRPVGRFTEYRRRRRAQARGR